MAYKSGLTSFAVFFPSFWEMVRALQGPWFSRIL